jgi:hypothetical protein
MMYSVLIAMLKSQLAGKSMLPLDDCSPLYQALYDVV